MEMRDGGGSLNQPAPSPIWAPSGDVLRSLPVVLCSLWTCLLITATGPAVCSLWRPACPSPQWGLKGWLWWDWGAWAPISYGYGHHCDGVTVNLHMPYLLDRMWIYLSRGEQPKKVCVDITPPRKKISIINVVMFTCFILLGCPLLLWKSQSCCT